MSRIAKQWHTLCLIFTFMFTVFTGGCVEEKTQNDADNVVGQFENNSSVLATGEEFNGWTEDAIWNFVDQIIVDDGTMIDAMTQSDMHDFHEALEHFGITLEQVANYAKKFEVEDSENAISLPNEDDPAYAGGLPNCNGYWGANWEGESVEYQSGAGFSYSVGPNCAMRNYDCGPDYDYMLSFYFGNHADNGIYVLRPKLRWWTNVPMAKLLMGERALSGRVYEQTWGLGRDNYQVYVCIPHEVSFYLYSFSIKKY